MGKMDFEEHLADVAYRHAAPSDRKFENRRKSVESFISFLGSKRLTRLRFCVLKLQIIESFTQTLNLAITLTLK